MSFLEKLENESAPEGGDNSRAVVSDAGFLDSARVVLKSHLGGRWLPFKLVVLLALVFWPVLAYWKSIQFDRSLFVSEWLKIAFESILLFLILEIIRHRSISFAVRQSVDRLLLTNYTLPAQTIITALQTFRKRLNEGEMQEAVSILRTAWQSWKAMEFALSDVSIQSLPYDYMRTQLLRCRLELKPARCESILTSLRAMRYPSEFNADEFEDLLSRFQVFVSALQAGRQSSENLEKHA